MKTKLAAILILAFVCGCQIVPTGTPSAPSTPQEKSALAVKWVKERSGFIEQAVAGITQVAVYSYDKDSDQRKNVIRILHTVSLNLNKLASGNSIDVDELQTSFKIEEDYFRPIIMAIEALILNEISTFEQNGYAQMSLEIIKSVSLGISDGTAQ